MTWHRRFLYSAPLILVIVAAVSTRGFLVAQIGRSLVCTGGLEPSDVILVENFDPNYLLFERAAALEKTGLAPRSLVHVQVSRNPGVANPVSKGIAEVMARQARMREWDVIPIREIEPISLNAASQIRDHLAREPVKSIILVTPGFRSRRSLLVYRAVMGSAGVQVRCDPVFGEITPERWTETWHGIQEVALEFGKLQYYRFYVLPFISGGRGDR